MLAVGFMNLLFFYFGMKINSDKKLDITMPVLNPVHKYKEYKEKEEWKKEQERLDTIMQNINCYDGTSIGQKDLPM